MTPQVCETYAPVSETREGHVMERVRESDLLLRFYKMKSCTEIKNFIALEVIYGGCGQAFLAL
jgi:hypothetical protein